MMIGALAIPAYPSNAPFNVVSFVAGSYSSPYISTFNINVPP